MDKIDIANLKTKQETNQAIKDMHKLSWIDFCLKYNYGKSKDAFKAVKYLKKLEKRLRNHD